MKNLLVFFLLFCLGQSACVNDEPGSSEKHIDFAITEHPEALEFEVRYIELDTPDDILIGNIRQIETDGS